MTGGRPSERFSQSVRLKTGHTAARGNGRSKKVSLVMASGTYQFWWKQTELRQQKNAKWTFAGLHSPGQN
jgi:hypothetical protein